MEEQITNAGGILLKFWMHIDKDEQERRFHEREQIPEKQWKITDEDWRNRARWDDYEKAVDEMILRTSTESAPWIVVEGNSKYYARIKVLKTVVDAIEQKLKEMQEEKERNSLPPCDREFFFCLQKQLHDSHTAIKSQEARKKAIVRAQKI